MAAILAFYYCTVDDLKSKNWVKINKKNSSTIGCLGNKVEAGTCNYRFVVNIPIWALKH